MVASGKAQRVPLVFSQHYPSALENLRLLKAAPNRQFRPLLRGLILLGFNSLQQGSASTIAPNEPDKE